MVAPRPRRRHGERAGGPAAYDPLGNYAGLPEPPPTGQAWPQPSGYYGPIWGGAGSLSTNYNNFATGCTAASGGPADCNSAMLQKMGAGFVGSLPGAHDDMWWAEQVYAGHVRANFRDSSYNGWPQSGGEYWGWGESGRYAGGARLTSAPQQYDRRVDFRDYALALSNDQSMTDCRKLVLLIYKAGQVWGIRNHYAARDVIQGLMSGLTEFTRVALNGAEGPSKPEYRVGVFRRDPHFGRGFGDSGFIDAFRDGGGNQVRHFIAYLGVGYGMGSTLGNQGLYYQEGTSDVNDPDVALGLVGTELGSGFDGDFRKLAQDVWNRVCGETSKLQW